MRGFRWCVVALLLGLVGVHATAVAQVGANAAAEHKAVARTQLELLKRNLRYVIRTAGEKSDSKLEQSRLQLVKSTTASVAALQAGAPWSSFTATAMRLGGGIREAQETDYKRANSLSATRGNSLDDMQAFWQATAAAQQRVALLTDSLELVRRAFAEDEGVRYEIVREVEIWTRATRQVAEIFSYYPQVLIPCLRMRGAIKHLISTLQAHDGAGFVLARQTLAVEAGFAAAELATVPDFMNLDVAFRDAGRAFAAQQLDASGAGLAQASELMQQQQTRELTAIESQQINQLLNAYLQQTEAQDKGFSKASETFLRLNSPDLAPNHPH